jgi:hypothetical protein
VVRFVFSLLLILITRNSQALEVYRNSLTANADHWTFYYNEDKKWILESVALDSQGWPKLEKRSVFANETQARVMLTAAVAGHVRSRSLPSGSEVLRGAAGQSLWTVTHEWTWEWELKYSEWVKTEIDKFWWIKHGLATDCADVAYSARWIFARNNGLPMANRLGSGQWFTQDSVKPEWARLPAGGEWDKDQRFMAALNYMLDFVFTHTLWNDSYPIAITPESLIPGAHHLNLSSASGHTQYIYRVGHNADEVPVLTLNSTVPREKRELMEFIFFNEAADPADSAFLRMRWPETKNGRVGLKAGSDMPFYSVEQFDPGFVRAPRTLFWEEVFYRLNPAADFDLIGQRTVAQVLDLLKARVPVVEDGYRACRAHPCVKGGTAWETWSTPSRDDRIRATVDTYFNLFRFITRWDLIDAILDTPVLSQEGYTFTARMLMTGFNNNFHSSDPNDEPVTRWGVHPRAAAAKVFEGFERGMAEREAKIRRAHRCRDESCLFGSDEFARAGTFATDSALSLLSHKSGIYCDSFGRTMCAELERILQNEPVTAHGMTRSLWDWLGLTVHFNSDPRVGDDRRYSGYTHEIAHFLFDRQEIPNVVSHEGRLFFDGNHLYSLNGAEFRAWPVPTGERAQDLDGAEGWIWTSMGEFVLARKEAADPPLRFALPTPARATFAHGGHLLAADEGGVHLLMIENGALTEIGTFPGASFERARDGFALVFAANDQGFLIDMKAGIQVALPEQLPAADDIRRVGTGYFLKYDSIVEGRVVCRLLAADGSSADLSPDGNCINYAPADQIGIAEVNGRAILRVFDRGRVVSQEDVGGVGEYYSDRLLKTVRDARYRYFCFGSENLTEMQKPPGVLDLAACNDDYVIEAVTADDWRARSRATGAVALRSRGFMDFASRWPREHYVITGANWGREDESFGLLDLKRPDRFSVVSGGMVWGSPEPYERAGGVLVYKEGRMMWVAD